MELAHPEPVDVPGLDAPLWIAGHLPPRRVAIVGARMADPYGLSLARRVAHDAVALGWAVVSGGAEGCDHAAHEGALEAGGATVVVLPAGHRHLYPRAHAPLYARVVERGAVVSARPPDARPSRASFLARNHVIAALADAVVVVRARLKSGSLSTAAASRALGKPVGAIPGDVGQVLSEGCHHLLATGAVPILGPASLSRLLGAPRSGSPWPLRATGQAAPWEGAANVPLPGLEPDDEAALAVVRREPGLDLDGIAVRTNLPLGVLVGVLTNLEVAGRITRWPGGRYGPHH
ncbi:MAG: DNA-processing protein DprA [Deltaproteobacteria bacterium]|nr:DNA-processing protein DprA [Deltaproteobacteria bacterium]